MINVLVRTELIVKVGSSIVQTTTLTEADTRAKLIDPKIHQVGWSEDLIRRETTAGTIEIINGKPRRKNGRTDYLLCLPSKENETPLAIAVLEAKKESEFATLGLEQAKEYAKRLHAPFIFSTNGHLFVEYYDFLGKISEELELGKFPSPETLQNLYEKGRGFSLSDETAKALFVSYQGGQSERRYARAKHQEHSTIYTAAAIRER